MSSNKRVSLYEALTIEKSLSQHIKPLCAQYGVAGSVRRDSPSVGDLEIVVIPHNSAALFARLDTMVSEGVIKKRLYNSAYGPVNRWGDKLRCFVYRSITVELTIADPHNYGYKFWLRTGPAEGNQFVMYQLAQDLAPLRFRDGYSWLVSYTGSNPSYEQRLSIPDETVLFRALNLPFVYPKWRSEAMYKSNWQGTLSERELSKLIIHELKQKPLF